MKHNYPNTSTPASLEHLRKVAPKRQGNLDWWRMMMGGA